MKTSTPAFGLALTIGLAALLLPGSACLAAGAVGVKGTGHSNPSARRATEAGGLKDATEAGGLKDAIDAAGNLSTPSLFPEAEPASLAVLGASLVGVGFLRRRGAPALSDRHQANRR